MSLAPVHPKFGKAQERHPNTLILEDILEVEKESRNLLSKLDDEAVATRKVMEDVRDLLKKGVGLKSAQAESEGWKPSKRKHVQVR